jgi:hypothetical protein
MARASVSVERAEQKRVTLLVRYADKECRIELPVAEPLFDREPSVDAYRRELQTMLSALEEWEQSHEDIKWPRRG